MLKVAFGAVAALAARDAALDPEEFILGYALTQKQLIFLNPEHMQYVRQVTGMIIYHASQDADTNTGKPAPSDECTFVDSVAHCLKAAGCSLNATLTRGINCINSTSSNYKKKADDFIECAKKKHVKAKVSSEIAEATKSERKEGDARTFLTCVAEKCVIDKKFCTVEQVTDHLDECVKDIIREREVKAVVKCASTQCKALMNKELKLGYEQSSDVVKIVVLAILCPVLVASVFFILWWCFCQARQNGPTTAAPATPVVEQA